MSIVLIVRSKWCVYWRFPQPLGIRRPNINDGVMNVRETGRADLGHPDPAVLFETRRHDLVRVVYIAASRNLNRCRHRDDNVRLHDIPSLEPMFSWWCITGISRRR